MPRAAVGGEGSPRCSGSFGTAAISHDSETGSPISAAFATAPTSPTHSGSWQTLSVDLSQEGEAWSAERGGAGAEAGAGQARPRAELSCAAPVPQRPTRMAASPRVSSQGELVTFQQFNFRSESSETLAPASVPASATLAAGAPDVGLMLRIMESLQAEKHGLDTQLCEAVGQCSRLQTENEQLRASNMEKDRQIAQLFAQIQASGQ